MVLFCVVPVFPVFIVCLLWSGFCRYKVIPKTDIPDDTDVYTDLLSSLQCSSKTLLRFF